MSQESDDVEVLKSYGTMRTKDLVDLALAFEADVKGVTGKPSMHFASHRLVLIARELAHRYEVVATELAEHVKAEHIKGA